MEIYTASAMPVCVTEQKPWKGIEIFSISILLNWYGDWSLQGSLPPISANKVFSPRLAMMQERVGSQFKTTYNSMSPKFDAQGCNENTVGVFVIYRFEIYLL